MAPEYIFRLQIQGIQKSWTFDIPVGSQAIIIGRQPGVDIVLEHQQVSRRHASLSCTTTECQITDLGSANGTRVNGQKLAPQVPVILKPGDSIQIGGFNLDFEQISITEPVENIQVPEWIPQEDFVASNVEPEIPPLSPDLSPAPATRQYDASQPPPGLTLHSERLMNYLPNIYHTDFMSSFLAIFEAVLFPIEWQIDNFDLFLDPGTTPMSFLPWLANWFKITFDSTWNEAQQRAFLKEAHFIFSRLGTSWALRRVLEIYLGRTPEIDDQSEDLKPHVFRVRLVGVSSAQRKNIERLIDAYKPAHTTYILELDK